MEAGYPLPLAEKIAHSEADLHHAADLIAQGCSPETAAEILHLRRARPVSCRRVKVEAIEYGDRKVYSVGAFNRGVASWLARLPTVWVEGEVTELRRQARWASVFFTLKDPQDGSCLGVSMPRGQFDALQLDLADGDRVHVYGRPELYEARGEFRLRALSLERFGLGDHLAALERLKRKLAAEGLFAAERKRPLPLLPRRDRPRDRERRGRQARRPDRDHDALSAGARARRGDLRPGAARRRRGDRGSRRALPRRRRRGRRRPRRRQLRGPAAFQRRAARPGDRRAARCRS